jgi:hemolysin activation/secretion protein
VFRDLSSLTISGTLATNFRSQDPAPGDPDGIDSAAMKTRFSFDATHAWQFSPGWAFVSRLDGVWSPEPLPDIQKFSMGGPYAMRGYESSEARGDYGYHLAVELQRGFRAFGASHSVSAFVEGASVGTHDFDIGALPVPSTRTEVIDAGLALTLNPTGSWGATLQYAVPIDDYVSPDTGDDGRFWAALVARF